MAQAYAPPLQAVWCKARAGTAPLLCMSCCCNGHADSRRQPLQPACGRRTPAHCSMPARVSPHGRICRSVRTTTRLPAPRATRGTLPLWHHSATAGRRPAPSQGVSQSLSMIRTCRSVRTTRRPPAPRATRGTRTLRRASGDGRKKSSRCARSSRPARLLPLSNLTALYTNRQCQPIFCTASGVAALGLLLTQLLTRTFQLG